MRKNKTPRDKIGKLSTTHLYSSSELSMFNIFSIPHSSMMRDRRIWI
jgi:hypothetical protein